MRKALLAALAVAGAVLALAGCSTAPQSGVIHAKDYSPGYTYFVSTCVSYGKYGCRAYMPVPQYQPPEWRFDLYASKSDHGWLDVDQPTFDRFHVGDFYRQ